MDDALRHARAHEGPRRTGGVGGADGLIHFGRGRPSQYPYCPQSEVGHLGESLANGGRRVPPSQTASAEGQKGTLAMRFWQQQPVFSRGERAMFWMVSVLV